MCQLLLFPIRFIPADAGNSSVISNIAELNAVYPRWRGELSSSVPPTSTARGLPPLARGTRWHFVIRAEPQRFIPAGAGNSMCVRRDIQYCAVYPRWRGELNPKTEPKLIFNGLSPLARGTPDPRGAQIGDLRFIPAGAGNSLSGQRAARGNTVYPRWRGELQIQRAADGNHPGLSPLARGTLKPGH